MHAPITISLGVGQTSVPTCLKHTGSRKEQKTAKFM